MFQVPFSFTWASRIGQAVKVPDSTSMNFLPLKTILDSSESSIRLDDL
jgi:hypothetical protein